MTPTRTFPGVYIKETTGTARNISGVSTSTTAFVGRAARGRSNFPHRVQSFAQYEEYFGSRTGDAGLSSDLTMPDAVDQFFRHGGNDALIVRIHDSAASASLELAAGSGTLRLLAESPGSWGNRLRITVDHDTSEARVFNLLVEELAQGSSSDVVRRESFRDVSLVSSDSLFITEVLAKNSRLLRVDVNSSMSAARPSAIANAMASHGSDGNAITDAQLSAANLQSDRRGIWALDYADLFNLLYIPPLTPATDVSDSSLTVATLYCHRRRAVHIIDPKQSWNTAQSAEAGVSALHTAIGQPAVSNAAVYFPRLRVANPLPNSLDAEHAPGGAVAGIIARTDLSRGVWKAPAGTAASFTGVAGLTVAATHAENGQMNKLGLNVLRSFPSRGHLIWGARTLAGGNPLSAQWKYLSVRRTALFIEESLLRGTKWVVFEPNDEPLWAQIRTSVGDFMHALFRQGAFRGNSSEQAYFVKCDRQTNSWGDIKRGIVNIELGFAPIKPAEFVIIRIQQKAQSSGA
ncbi:MAG: phage tail sheath family protein [Congregibacter sp.]